MLPTVLWEIMTSMSIDAHSPKSASYSDRTDFTKVSAPHILSYMHNYQALSFFSELINKVTKGIP